MTKLTGTSGQLFSGLAESLNIRGTSRSAKSAGGKSQSSSSFNDLLHTVSNLAKQALNDGGSETTAKPGTLRTRLAHPGEAEKPKTAVVPERVAASEHAKSSEEPSDKTTDKPSEKQRRVDHAAKPDVQAPSNTAVVIGQEIAAAPAVKPQMQLQSADKDAPAREEGPSTKREVQGTKAAATTETASPDDAPAAARPRGAASQVAAAPQPLPAQDSEPSGAMPATAGFEAVTANVERAARAAGREALPEPIKVTVVQQETHLPPAQFSAPQQVASAVVAELKESASPAASAAPDLTASQTNAPDQPLKILTLNLEPPALGNVTVRLRLVGTEVSIHLAAERKDTSQMLDQQRDSIRDLMQSAGYVADVAPVQHGSLDGFQSGSGQSQPQFSGQQQPSSQSQGTFGGAGTPSGQSDGGARQARQERQSNQETRHDQELGQQNRRGPVYL
ncbi:flagellar hook-length control protein FliK [Bradyrhizobium sp. UNPF46]|uniref:flagellar hook-length control protein FliK n=1 Tax=Bradyrhizobium sp. UNPF46 TaxID=1141168 RepID=UPI0011512637|nr:flagellar hook-length control protein FliK [Bradyrhizobium sp. UNPF46]TQF41711.1 flagellar hook-length control protein FliK [Bradyrhizobium sp. UNPF46]